MLFSTLETLLNTNETVHLNVLRTPQGLSVVIHSPQGVFQTEGHGAALDTQLPVELPQQFEQARSRSAVQHLTPVASPATPPSPAAARSPRGTPRPTLAASATRTAPTAPDTGDEDDRNEASAQGCGPAQEPPAQEDPFHDLI